MQFYELHESQRFSVLDSETTKLQAEMWKTVQGVASTQPTPTVALAVGGMNDVLNRQGYTQAAWWNRIPTGAWALLAGISVCCCVLVGYGAHRRKGMLFAILPFLISIAFGFIADIDSPRHGVIPVSPQNWSACRGRCTDIRASGPASYASRMVDWRARSFSTASKKPADSAGLSEDFW